ncbi:MAG: NAD(P)/FAD-dependent oxidoreductase [Solirubrobacteraceae bacterium]|nr:NAD(P)/FAD-dependent oxidoreductase [Solirubrobacteraceae bacterium]
MRVAVLGAGVAGLVCAYRLTQEGHVCDVYERWPGLGGQAATLDVGGGDLLERYYHHLFTSDRHIVALYDELGMGGELEWKPSSMAFFLEGRQWAFTTPLDLLRFGPLSPPARLRMGLAVLLLQKRAKEVGPFESITAREWIERRMGRGPWRKVWGPLLRGKFGTRADDISMAWLWSKLTLRRQLEGDEAKQELLGYPAHSWELLFDALRDAICAGGGRVLIDRPAAALRRAGGDGGGFVVAAGVPGSFRRGHDPRRFERVAAVGESSVGGDATAHASAAGAPAQAGGTEARARAGGGSGGEERYDAVVATVPSDVFEGLLDDDLASAIGPAYLERLRATEYHTALCLLLELDRPFSPFYWTNIADPEVPFVGLVEHTNLISPERYHGRRFLYVANYLAPGDPLLALSPEQLLDAYMPGLLKVQPAFSTDWIRARWLHREPAAQPIVTVGYHRRIPPLRTGVPGLVLANTTQIYPEDRGTNYSVRLGTDAARALLDA